MDVWGCWQARGDPRPSLEKTARLEHLSQWGITPGTCFPGVPLGPALPLPAGQEELKSPSWGSSPLAPC